MKNKFEEVEIHLVGFFCDKEKISVDIGTAGSGPYTEQMLKHSRKVYSYEPHPVSAKRMREKFSNSIILRECAVFDKVGLATLSTPVRDGVPPDEVPGKPALSSIYKDFSKTAVEAARYEVHTTTIDHENLPSVSLIKIDVEGAEIEVLKGSKETIETYRPFIIIEMDEQHRVGTLETNTTFFEELEYSGFYVENKTTHPIREFISSGRVNISMQVDEGAIYNFIFIPNEKISVLGDIKTSLKNI